MNVNARRLIGLTPATVFVLVFGGTPPALAVDAMDMQHQTEIEAVARAKNITVEESTARDQYRQRAQPLYDAVSADPFNFAGIYSTDEGGRWRIVVRYVGDAPLADVMTLVADDIPVEWIGARYSMAELNNVFADLLVKLGPDIQARRVSQVTPDEASNTVLVGIPESSPELERALLEQYGDLVSFQIVPVFEPIP